MKTKKLKFFIIIPIVAIAAILGYRVITQALIDDSNSVHVDPTQIEDSTMIIGTHLIYIGSMNDSIYEIAEQSAEQSSQYSIYYKSELAGGVWYDITDASSLDDITTEGKPVEDKVIAELNLTHHTKSDGITYDLLSGEAVAINDIISPYDLENMEELSSLKLQYENLTANDDRSDTDDRNLMLIKDFYKLDFSDKLTDECDKELAALKKYYQALKSSDSEAYMSDIVQKVMDDIDAKRRAEVFGNIQIEALDNLINAVSRNQKYSKSDILDSKTNNDEAEDEGADIFGNGATVPSEDEEEDEDNQIEGFYADNNLLSALSEAQSNVEESYNTYKSKMLDEGNTVLSKTEYAEVYKLIDAATNSNGDYTSCNAIVNNLSCIDAVNNGIIRHQDIELEYISNTLIPKANEEFEKAFSAGVSAEYKALPSTAVNATRASLLKSQKAELDMVRTELQFIIQAKLDRMTNEEAVKYVSTLIEQSSNYSPMVKNDDYAEYANSSIDSYIQWLNEKLTSLQNANGDGVMAGLVSEKDALKQERLEALDNNDLAEAKRLAAEIEALDKAISDEETRLNNIINSDTASAAEKAAAKASLNSSTVSGLINDLESSALDSLKKGDYDGVDAMLNSIGGLAGSNSQAALNSLKNIYDELNRQKLMNDGDSSELDKLLTEVENVASENIGVYTTDLSEADFAKLIAALLGLDLGDDLDMSKLLGADSNLINASEQAIVLAALGMYVDETGSVTAQKLVDKYAPAKYSEGNIHVFHKYTQDLLNCYAPADRIARIAGYRYIFNDSQKKAVLQKGGTYYEFNAFSTIVIREKNGKDEMSLPAGYMSTLYICEEFAAAFETKPVYLPNSDYGVLLSNSDMDEAEKIFDYFVEAGGKK